MPGRLAPRRTMTARNATPHSPTAAWPPSARAVEPSPLQVEVGLQVHPELRRRLEELREPQRRVGGHLSDRLKRPDHLERNADGAGHRGRRIRQQRRVSARARRQLLGAILHHGRRRIARRPSGDGLAQCHRLCEGLDIGGAGRTLQNVIRSSRNQCHRLPRRIARG